MTIISTDRVTPVSTPTPREWARLVAAHGTPSDRRAIAELALTLVPFFALWGATWMLLSAGYWAAVLLMVPMAGLLLRTFIIQHDCGHGSFMSSKAANAWIGRFCGVLTMTPYAFWNHAHKLHHMGAGSLSRRGIGDIKTMTVAEFNASTPMQRFKYRLYRHPIVMFGVGPAYIFFVDQRLPMGDFGRRGPWISTMGTNLGILALWAVTMWFVGWQLFLLIQVPVTVLAASAGVWLFYVQHQFEETVWEDDQEWSFHEAALYGSSHYDLPQPLRWFSGNIGLHHIHHLSSRIPFYRLPKVIEAFPELGNINRMTLRQSLKSATLTLWDEKKRMMVPLAAA